MAIPFQYESEYKRKLCTPDEAARVVKSGDWLDISMGCAFPSLMDAAIAKRKEELYGVKIRGYLIQQPIQMVECDPGREHFIYNSWHMSGYERKLCDRGMCSFNPMVFRNLGAYYQHFLTVNVAMMCVTPMNQHGYFNFSLSNASARAVLDKADIVILEINENLPWVYGGLDECIHIDDVDMIVEGPHNPLPSIQTPPASEAETRIAEFVVENMDDGATLQLGIGGTPAVIGSLLAASDVKDLGMHTELCSDAYVDLYEAGKLTNARKTEFPHKGVTGIICGTKRLYDWVDDNPAIAICPLEYVNRPEVIARQAGMISVNGCVAADLYGQVCSESAGTRQVSGTGGQLDYLTGAPMAPGGQAFLCMTSTYTDKTGTVRSRIVPTFHGDIVTSPRSQMYWIVTEYGAVNLAGRSTWERAEALISIAHPDFREELIAAAQTQNIWRRSNKR